MNIFCWSVNDADDDAGYDDDGGDDHDGDDDDDDENGDGDGNVEVFVTNTDINLSLFNKSSNTLFLWKQKLLRFSVISISL